MTNVIDQIRKLRAVAEDPSTTEEEAAAFSAKVSDLLARHGLSMTDLRETEKGEIEGHHWHTMYLDPWRRQVIMAASRLYFCDIYLRKWLDRSSNKTREGIVIVGRPHNVEVAREMSEYLIATVGRLAKNYADANFDAHRTHRAVQIQFERGCGERVAARLRKLKEEQRSGAPQRTPSGNPGNLPALYDDEEELIRRYKEALALGKAATRASVLATRHSSAGWREGDNVGLNAQIHGSKRGSLLT